VVDLPFFSTRNSSDYLTRAIDAAGLGENEVAFMNSTAKDGGRNRIPHGVQVVALGKAAAAECSHQNILRYAEIPHPQYWRRFHRFQLTAYAEMLRKAVRRA
jgi:hypothetical protein